MYEINPKLDKIYWDKPLQSLANQNEGVSRFLNQYEYSTILLCLTCKNIIKVPGKLILKQCMFSLRMPKDTAFAITLTSDV